MRHTQPRCMARNVTPAELHIRELWKSWLSQYVGRKRPISVVKLDSKLRTARLSDARYLIYNWLNGGQTASPTKVYAVGEALHQLGQPFTSGVVSLFAAGYYSLVVELLIRMSEVPDGSWPALAFYTAFEEWLQFPMVRADFGFPVDRTVRKAGVRAHVRVWKEMVQLAIDSSSPNLALMAKRQCNGGDGCTLLTRKAILTASFESREDAQRSVCLAWQIMVPWAHMLYRTLGGRSGYPRFRDEYHVSELTHQPLEMILELAPKATAT